MERAAGLEPATDGLEDRGSDELVCESARHGVGVRCNYGQQHLCRLVRTMRTLLPISHRAERQGEACCDLLLRQLQFRAQGAYRWNAPRPRKLRLAGWPSIRIGQRRSMAIFLAHRIERAPISLRWPFWIESKFHDTSFFHAARLLSPI